MPTFNDGATNLSIRTILNSNGIRKNNYSATTGPTASADAISGYEIGSLWFDVATAKVYFANDVTTGAAIWIEVAKASDESDNQTLSWNAVSGELTISGGNTISGVGTQNIFNNFSVSGQTSLTPDTDGDEITFVAGTGMTITTNDIDKSITFDSSDTTNSFSSIAVATQNNVVADSGTDTLTFVAGTNMSIATNAATDTITFNTTAISSSGVLALGEGNWAGNIVPIADSTYNLGNETKGWNNVYVRGNLVTTGATVVGLSTLSITEDTNLYYTQARVESDGIAIVPGGSVTGTVGDVRMQYGTAYDDAGGSLPPQAGSFFFDSGNATLKVFSSTAGNIFVDAGKVPLTVQDDTLINEYYIYVGNPVNKLSAIQDYRQSNTGLAYDQEFAYLDQAFKFIMENPIDEVGTIDPSYGNTQRKAVWVIALEESVTHIPNPTTDYDSFDLWNVNHQILLLNQNALNPTPAIAECYAVIDVDLKLWGIPLFQPATKDLKFAGRLDATDCHIRTANNSQGFGPTIFEDDIWITNSFFRLNNCDFKPIGSKQIGIWDNSVADIDIYAVDETSGTLKLAAISSVIVVDQNASNISLRDVNSWDNSLIRFTSDVTVSGTISARNSEIRIPSSLTFNGASARFNLEQTGKVIYGSVNAVLSTSHIMGGDTISHPDAQPFLDLSEASWKDGVKTINAGAGYNQIGQYRGTFRLPNIDTTARNSLTAANGDMIYNTTDSKLQGYQAGAWINIDGT